MEAIVYSKPIVYGKPIVFKSKVVFPSVSNNFRGTQLTWQYHHHHRQRCRLGFMCYQPHHHHQSRADEQLKLVTIKETPATQTVEPAPKPKPKPKPTLKEKLRVVRNLLIGATAVCGVGYLWIQFVMMPKHWHNEMIGLRHPSQSNMMLFMMLSSLCTGILIGISEMHNKIDETGYGIRLIVKIFEIILMLGFVSSSLGLMSASYAVDTFFSTNSRHWNYPLYLYRAISTVSMYICGLGLIVVDEYYERVDENDSENGLDLKVSVAISKVFGAISMGVDVASSPEFMSIAYSMDTLSRTVFRHWHWPYNINLAVLFILLHICCRGLRAVIDLRHKHSGMQKVVEADYEAA